MVVLNRLNVTDFELRNLIRETGHALLVVVSKYRIFI